MAQKVKIPPRGSIPGSERFLGKGNGNPLQYSCLKNPRDRGAWRLQSSTEPGRESERTEQLTHTCAPTLQRAPLDTLPQTLGGRASLCLLWLRRASSALVQEPRPDGSGVSVPSSLPREARAPAETLAPGVRRPRSHPRTCTCALAAQGCHRAGPEPGSAWAPPARPARRPAPPFPLLEAAEHLAPVS